MPEIVLSLIQANSKWLTMLSLILGLAGTILLGWGYLKWRKEIRAKFSSEYGVVTGMTFNIGKEKAGFILIVISIIVQLIVQVGK